jgi:EPS-associated MarR family transcriptional regulator
MKRAQQQIREDVNYRVLRLLQDNPELTQRDLAKLVGVSAGGIHYILKALVQKGLVKLGNFSAAPDKRRYSYILTAQGLTEKAALTRRFLSRKMEEYHALRAEIEAIGAELSKAEHNTIKARLSRDGIPLSGAEAGPDQLDGRLGEGRRHE